MDAVTNVGIRPTFDETSLTVETFVLNNAVPEGAARARLEFLHRLRDEKRFNSPDELRAQIGMDVRRAQRFFSSVFGSSARRG
jgi:riboflavin kinase/FMN adenylyltransferase